MRNLFIILTTVAFILYFVQLIKSIFTKKFKNYLNRNWLYLTMGVASLLGLLFIPNNALGGFFFKCVCAVGVLTYVPFFQCIWRAFSLSLASTVCFRTPFYAFDDCGTKIITEHGNIMVCNLCMLIIMFFTAGKCGLI